MTNVLPQQAGLQVTGVVYRYTTVKEIVDDMIVHVQNQNALGPGYIFRSSDDWSGKPGNTINKAVPVSNIPIQFWGDGAIEVEGKGKVQNASVIYTYQFDPCFDPQSDPTCPGYVNPATLVGDEVNVRDPLDDEFIRQELERKAKLEDEEEKEQQRKKVAAEKKQRERLEVALGAINSALMTAEAEAKAAELFSMNIIPNTYYVAIPGGTYEETVTLVDKKLPDNRQGLRMGLSQQLLHEKMMNAQYENLSNRGE
jgi:hypothetical protein